jgi:hypothetical protein
VRKDYFRKITVILSTFLSSSWAKKWFFWQISFSCHGIFSSFKCSIVFDFISPKLKCFI